MNSLKFVSYKLREQIMDINYIYNLFVHQLNRVRDLSKLIKNFILSVSAAKLNNGWGGWVCLSVKFVFLKISQSLECYVTVDGLTAPLSISYTMLLNTCTVMGALHHWVDGGSQVVSQRQYVHF